MNIEIISCNTVKAMLTKEDLKDFDLSYRLLDQNSFNTQMLLLYIIDEIKVKEGIDLSEQKIYIEIFPVKDAGCLFYFSAAEESCLKIEEKTAAEHICAVCDNIEKIKTMSSHLYRNKVNNSIINSELYHSEKLFYIIISILYDNSAGIKSVISEYCRIVGSGEVYSEMIREHYSYISDNNALKMLSELQ